MTNTRLRYNGVATGSAGSLADLTLSGSHTYSTTTLTFNAALTYANGTAVPTLAGGDYFMLSILDTGGRVAEVVKVTAYTTAGTTATVTRGQEGTSGVAHAAGAKVVHSATALDANGGPALLATTTLASAATSITFSGADIPSTGYQHLQIKMLARTTTATTNDTVFLYFNGDTVSTNYRTRWFYSAGSFDVSQNNGSNGMFVAGSTAVANRAGWVSIDVLNHAQTVFQKVAGCQFYEAGSSTTAVIGSSGIEWFSTNAITSVTLTVGGAGQFVAGTTVSLYGLP